MLIIRKEQYKVLAKYALESFATRMKDHLLKRFPEQTKGSSEMELREFIRKTIDQAEPYDIVNKGDVQRFLEYCVLYGPEFDTNEKFEEVQVILNDSSLTGTMKMSKVDEYFLFMRDEKG